MMMDAEKSKDLDETRRLLYAGLAVAAFHEDQVERLNRHALLAGTIANALAHHQNRGYEPPEAIALTIGILRGEPRSMGIANRLIRKITAELEATEAT